MSIIKQPMIQCMGISDMLVSIGMATGTPLASGWRPAVELIERARLARLLTRKELADLASIDEATLNDLIRGVTKPYLRTLSQLAAALRIPPGSLVTFTGLEGQAGETSRSAGSRLSLEMGERREVSARAAHWAEDLEADGVGLSGSATRSGHPRRTHLEMESDRGPKATQTEVAEPEAPRATKEASGAPTPSAP